jgi:hypothetical protein
MNEVEIWKEAVVTYFKILYQQISGGNEKNHNKLRIACGPPVVL